MFNFSCSWYWSPLFLTSSFFYFCWNGGGNCCGPVLGVWNGDTLLSLHGQYCFIQGLWFIAFCFSWMWPCCLRREGVLVGTLRPQSKSHTSCIKYFPSLVSKKNNLSVVNYSNLQIKQQKKQQKCLDCLQLEYLVQLFFCY